MGFHRYGLMIGILEFGIVVHCLEHGKEKEDTHWFAFTGIWHGVLWNEGIQACRFELGRIADIFVRV